MHRHKLNNKAPMEGITAPLHTDPAPGVVPGSSRREDVSLVSGRAVVLESTRTPTPSAARAGAPWPSGAWG